MDPGRHGVVYEVDEPLAVVRLDRPARLNAFTFETVVELRRAVARAAADPRVVAIAVTGTGRAFSAGLDSADLARSAEAPESVGEVAEAPGTVPALFSELLRVPKPTIAAVNGVAAGGGLVLAMMCDLRFAAEEASFTTVFSKRGLIAEHGTSWLLPRLIGASRALDLLWSSRRFDAAEALRIGFVDRVVPGTRLLEEVRSYVRDLAANVSPRALAVIKEQVYADLSASFETACRAADRLMREALAHPDAREGASALVERRPPRFARLRGENG